MIFLQHHESFADIASLDPESHRVEWTKREQWNRTQTSGWIGKIGNEQVLFYKREGHLRVAVGDREFDADRVDVSLTREAASRRFELQCDGESVLDVTYPLPRISPPSNDVLSPGEDDENYDFAILVHNILTNPERLKVCLETWA